MLVEPTPLAVRRAGNLVELNLAITPDLEYFPDHFPRYPMLPGVVQLGWAVRAAQREFDVGASLRRVAALKFMQPIRPIGAVTLQLEQLGAQEAAFSYRDGDTVLSSGRLQFSAA